MEISLILAFTALAVAIIGLGIAISTIILSKDIRKDQSYTKFWDAPDALLNVLADLRKRSQTDSDGNGPPHPPEMGMMWALDHTACDQGHYGFSTWKQIPEPIGGDMTTATLMGLEENDNH